MNTATEPVIAMKDVYYEVGGQVILDGATCHVSPGEIFGIMGMSGVGKSTALRLIMGLIRPQRGEIWVLGQPVHDMRERDLVDLRMRMGLCFQGAALFDAMTVEENVAFGLRRLQPDLPLDEVRRRVLEQLDIVGMEGTEDKYPAQLSGGMRKRVGIARALNMHPQVLLYDEPTAGLDPIMSGVIIHLIAKLRDQYGTTSVVVTHEVDALFKIADRVIMLYQGRIIAEDSPANLRCCSSPEVNQFVQGLPTGPIAV